jgi:hypothetical protein
MRTKRAWWALALCVAAGALLVRLSPRSERRPERHAASETPASLTHRAVPAEAGAPASAAAALAARLRVVGHASGATVGLTELRAWLAGLPVETASQSIREVLALGLDAPTQAGFKLQAEGGWLTEAPTLRVFLLDYLARVDRTAAAEVGRQILAAPGSPDEWAVALRNVALGESAPATRVFLEQKLAQMLEYAPWLDNPSVGFLEAFDVAVHLGGTNLLAPLTKLVRRQDNRAVAHAAYLALDRLTIADAASTLAVLQADPTLMQGRESSRAGYFARADVRAPAQRQVLEAYLLNPALGTAELGQFSGLYPNANYMISHNLLTSSPTPDGATLAARDRAALRVVEEWLNDPRFERLKPHLTNIHRRLTEFVRPASR